MTRRLCAVLALITLAACAHSQRAFHPIPEASSGVTSPEMTSGWLGSAPEQVAVFAMDGAAYAIRAADYWGFLALSMEILNMGQGTTTVDPTAFRLFVADGFEIPPVSPRVVATRVGGQHGADGGYSQIDERAEGRGVEGIFGPVEGVLGPIELLPGTVRRGRLFYEVPPDALLDLTVRIPDGREIRFEYGVWSQKPGGSQVRP